MPGRIEKFKLVLFIASMLLVSDILVQKSRIFSTIFQYLRRFTFRFYSQGAQNPMYTTVMAETEKRSFGGKIDAKLKARIDQQVLLTKIPTGVIVERLAEWWVGLAPEEQKMFCYGVNDMTLREYVRECVADLLDGHGSRQSDAGIMREVDAAAAAAKARSKSRRHKPPTGS